jgi:predicted aspartyl protease
MRITLCICFCLFAATFCITPVAAAPPESISFNLADRHNPLIMVPVYVEGKGPFEFVLDTGAFNCLLSPELSAAIGVLPEATQQVMGAGGPMKISSSHITSLAVGSAEQENIEVAVAEELSRFGTANQSKVDGLLGFNFLKDFRITFDHQHNLLRLARLSPNMQEENNIPVASSMSFRLVSRSKPLILLPVFVNGRGPFQFVLDTGASRTTLSLKLARKLGIVTIDDRPGTGGGGQVRISSGKVDSLAVGQASVRDLAVGVGDFLAMLSTAAGTRLDGIIGENFLSQFEVTIDYPHSTLDLNALVTR